MLKINDKTFLNIQEAVQWLMDNNALPFQCTANYAANTEIGLGTIVNPTMAKVRIGSLIFFADSKVSTVTGITANGFIVSDQYNDLVDDVVYVSNVQLNASGHLIVTLSNGTNIDAGLIKQVASFSIDGSQHLIATYNDGSTNDLGAIFSGNISISGNLTVAGSISGNIPTLTTSGDQIVALKPVIEQMNGYSFTKETPSAPFTFDYIYAGVAKNGNKLTLVCAIDAVRTGEVTTYGQYAVLGDFVIPADISNLIMPFKTGTAFGEIVTKGQIQAVTEPNVAGVEIEDFTQKLYGPTGLRLYIRGLNSLTLNTHYYIRSELTILLSENLAE